MLANSFNRRPEIAASSWASSSAITHFSVLRLQHPTNPKLLSWVFGD
ncbi:MAG: hypothetical protein QXT67_07695 [Candidatus Bathyarchaeia archaeon]